MRRTHPFFILLASCCLLAIFWSTAFGEDNPEQLKKRVEQLGGVYRTRHVGDGEVLLEVVFNNRKWMPDELAVLAKKVLVHESIENLELFRCSVDKSVVESIGKMKKLQNLNLGFTEIGDDGLKWVGQLTSLKKLAVLGTNITSIASISKNVDLLELDISFNSINDEGCRHIATFRKLEKLTAHLLHITDSSVDHLLKLENLRELNLGVRTIGDLGIQKLARLRKLELLDLDSTRMSDIGLAALMKMPKLTKVVVDCTGVTAEGVRMARKQRPDVNIVYDQ